MWPNDLLPDLDVSRESVEKLEIYHALLLKWQKAINLVSGKTLDETWVRHFADSAQMVQFIPEHVKSVVDFGSGAGFPAALIAILRPDLEVSVVESDERKCQFMRTVSRETNTPIRIINARIESVSPEDIAPDLITARALASVSQLLEYAQPFVAENSELEMLLLKGERASDEVSEAQLVYDFESDRYPSVTNRDACILHLKSIKKR